MADLHDGPRSRRRRTSRKPGLEKRRIPGYRGRGSSHLPRLTRMYMSVPGNRGTDDRILIGGAVAGVLILVTIGGWLILNSPRDARVSTAEHAQTTSVRFVGMTERNGVAQVRFSEQGREFVLSLSSASPIVAEVRSAKPGAVIQVPRSQVPMTEDAPKRDRPTVKP